jgi:hypothetical protein
MKRTLTVVVLGACVFSAAFAGDRQFVYSYDTETIPAGAWEYEQWVTWKHYSTKERFDVRHELEYGVTDRLQLGLYLVDWRYERVHGEKDKADYRDTAVELIYQMTDPSRDVIGSALYGEVQIGDEKVELETKLLLQKNIGPFVAIYNLILEAEWEGEDLGNLDEEVGVWGNTVGLSYEFAPGLYLGTEVLHEQELANWDEEGDHVVYAGPNMAVSRGGFFGALACLYQATHVEGEPEAQVRVIAGCGF